MAEKIGRGIRKSVKNIFAGIYLIVLGAVLLIDKGMEYPEWARNESLLPNIALAAAGVLFVAGGSFLWKRYLSRISFLRRFPVFGFYVLLWGMGGLLFLTQVFVSYHLYFIAGWDVSIVSGVADWVWIGTGEIGELFYFSQYTNNVAIVYVLAVISWTVSWLELKVAFYLALILADCVLISLAGIFAALSVKRLTGSRKWGLFSFVLFFCLTGINPWMVVPYTDTYSILFPVLTFYLYLCAKDADKPAAECALWVLLGLSGLVGYLIKPSAVIVLIAVVCYELLLLVTVKGRWKKTALHFVMLLAAWAVSHGIWLHMLDYTGSRLNEDLKFSYTHYLMMGLNEESVGAYNGDDYAFSSRQPDQETRRRENLRVAKERLSEYGLTGYPIFMMRKLLVNYNDGTFAWEKEGDFEQSPCNNEETPVHVLVRRLFRRGTDWYGYYATFAQGIWILLLIFVPASAFRRREACCGETRQDRFGRRETRRGGGEITDGECVLWISLIGSFLFVMLFEARARYLYNMTPVLIICGTLGFRKWQERIECAVFRKAGREPHTSESNSDISSRHPESAEETEAGAGCPQ